jgi:hypothetical protein
VILNPNESRHKEKMKILLKDMVNIFAEAGVGIIQMPFLDCDSYKNPKELKSFSCLITKQIKNYLRSDCHVLAILDTNKSRRFYNEMENEMSKKRFQIPIIGIDPENLTESMRKIQMLLRYCDF